LNQGSLHQWDQTPPLRDRSTCTQLTKSSTSPKTKETDCQRKLRQSPALQAKGRFQRCSRRFVR
jgi:hypothetical protein